MIWYCRPVRIVAVLLLGMLLGIGVYFFLSNNAKKSMPVSPTQGALITGVVNIDGTSPNDAIVVFLQREANTTGDFVQFHSHSAVFDDKEWHFDSATAGKSYEIKASVRSGKSVLAESSPIFITAPAQDEMLTVELPTQQTVTPAVAAISGMVGIDGYVPDGATIVMESRTAGTPNFAIVIENIPAKD